LRESQAGPVVEFTKVFFDLNDKKILLFRNCTYFNELKAIESVLLFSGWLIFCSITIVGLSPNTLF
jgi:hypothetical protein